MTIQEIMNGQDLAFVHVEQTNNKSCVVRVDLSGQADLNNESLRELLKKVYSVEKLIWPNHIYISSLMLRTRNVSGSAIMDLPKIGNFAFLTRLSGEVRVLDFSKTSCSANACNSLSKFPLLEEANFDDCKAVTLEEMPTHKNLRVLSLLGTSVSARCMKQILTKFPSLQRLNVTLQLESQPPLGFRDAHAYVHPHLNFPCGHFSTTEEADLCPNGKHDVVLAELPVQISRQELGWNIHLLDVFKKAIHGGEGVLLHGPCGALYGNTQPENGICPNCDEGINEKNLHQIHQALDPVLDMNTAFEPLPPRPRAQNYWQIVARSVETQAYDAAREARKK